MSGSEAEVRGYPDPEMFPTSDLCPYCMDARKQGLVGGLCHTDASMIDRSSFRTYEGTK